MIFEGGVKEWVLFTIGDSTFNFLFLRAEMVAKFGSKCKASVKTLVLERVVTVSFKREGRAGATGACLLKPLDGGPES